MFRRGMRRWGITTTSMSKSSFRALVTPSRCDSSLSEVAQVTVSRPMNVTLAYASPQTREILALPIIKEFERARFDQKWGVWGAVFITCVVSGMGTGIDEASCSGMEVAAKGTEDAVMDLGRVALTLTSEYNANEPIEDRHDIRESPVGDFYAAVYDGHGGWQVAEFARKRLAKAAQVELCHSLAKTSEQIKKALVQAFLRVEREYMHHVRSAFDMGFGSVARAGACALMAFIREDKLFVANAGDCRAVLGRRRPVRGWVVGASGGGGEIEAVVLSNDHNAREDKEQEKLRRLHPGEDDIIRCKKSTACYVKGKLQPTRSLGDAYLKYSEFNGQPGTHVSRGRYISPPYSPPYITAEPEITEHSINPELDEFVILASDGLWDYVSSQEAVEIVQEAAYQDQNPKDAGDRLIKRVLEKAAERYSLTVPGLMDVPEGSVRRSMHDDVTCVVFFLGCNHKNSNFAAKREHDRNGIQVAQ